MNARRLLVLIFLAWPLTLKAAPKVQPFTDAEARRYLAQVEMLDASKKGLYRKLTDRFGRRATYHPDLLTAIVDPNAKFPLNFKQEHRDPAKMPPGTLTAAEVEDIYALERRRNPEAKGSMAALRKNIGDYPWYKLREVRAVAAGGDDPKVYVYSDVRDPTPEVAQMDEKRAEEKRVGFERPKLRRDWRDMLFAEDPSQPDNSKQKLDDLVGATFSYAYNGKAHNDSWSAVGALILPWSYHSPVTKPDLLPEKLILAPSVSINRVATNAVGGTGEVDELFYRLGLHSEWLGPGLNNLLQLRAAGIYATDTGHSAQLRGWEADLEIINFSLAKYRLNLGARNILWPKTPRKSDGSDQSYIEYQVRVWLHAEGGELQNTGKVWRAVTGDFLRLGPVAQLRVNFPEFYKGASITAEYSQMQVVEGPREHDSLLRITAGLVLHRSETSGAKVSLSTEYVKGGLLYTKEEVETLTIGLGVLF